MSNDDTDFHLFVSYTRTPDAALAQEVERFLESFHTLRPPGGSEPLPPLRICVDGSDFSMPPLAEREGRVREILDVVYAHLARARELLVLFSSGAARSAWVDSVATVPSTSPMPRAGFASPPSPIRQHRLACCQCPAGAPHRRGARIRLAARRGRALSER